jgi:hypothetical protein
MTKKITAFRSLLSLFLFVFYVSAAMGQSVVSFPSEIKSPVAMSVSVPLRDLPPDAAPIKSAWMDGIIPVRHTSSNQIFGYTEDGVLQNYNGHFSPSEITINFDGVGAQGYAPPDPSGDVGPNHYVQMVNVRYQVWNKNGGSLLGPLNISTIWNGLPGPWAGSNDGDPIVLYDETADRWLVTQFALPNYPNAPFYQMVAVSTTGDPTGSFYLYAYQFDSMPDYPKFGVWSDGYYMSANRFASGSGQYLGTLAAVFDRTSMLSGQTANMILFNNGTNTGSLLPSDCDGILPPAGTPNYFMEAYGSGGTNHLEVFKFHTDWVTPGNSTFTGPDLITVATYSQPGSAPQLGTTQTLDMLSDRMMNRLQYRNFGAHQSMVACLSVNAGSGRAGMRWWELRDTGSGWNLYQEGTYAPADNIYRWMGSIAMDANGNIALGYSASSTTIHPQIRYTGRLAGDPLGVMTVTEGTIYAGNGSQTSGLSRWGDYTQMNVDPTNNSFWYTNEYIPSNGTFNWKTRIAGFTFGPGCPIGYPSNPSPLDGVTDVSINLAQLTWQNGGSTNNNELYFGTDPANLPLVQSGSLATNWNISSLPLDYNTNYYWYVVENGDTCIVTGPTWSFKTEPDPGLILSWFDNFDTYTAGQRLACQNPVDWTTWTLIPCSTVEDALISDAQSYSAPNSVVIVQNNDLVHPIGDLTYGKYSISFRSYIATGKNGYFNTLSGFTGGAYEWAMECYFNTGGQGSLNAGGTGVASFTFPYNSWNLVELIVDIDNDAAEFKFNGASIHTWPWSSGATGSGGQLQLAGTDFFGATAQDQMYVDDYTFVDLNVVPVELTSFAANAFDQNVELNWITATEINNQRFEIERKTAESQFRTIGYISGHGTTTEQQTYSFVDKKLETGKYFYRLKQFDFNGSFEYSNEIDVDVNALLTYDLKQNYPNPFNPNTLIKYSVAKDGFVNVSIFNLLGEKVATLVDNNMKAGSYEVNFDASFLSSGIYFYSIEAGDFKAVRKMVLMR